MIKKISAVKCLRIFFIDPVRREILLQKKKSEDQSEQRDRLYYTYDDKVVCCSLARFSERVGGCRGYLTLEKCGQSDCQSGKNAYEHT